MLSTLRQWMRNNPWRQMADTDRQVFAICVGAALAFWLILNLSQEYTVRRAVALDYLVDPGRVLVGTMPGTIETDVSGQGWTLIWEGLRPGPLPVTIDIRENEDNRLTTAQLKQQIQRNLSSGALSVGYIDFREIPILTTPLDGKRVPVRHDIQVRPAPGFVIIDSLYVSPDSITISAAGDVLEELDSWPTAPLDIVNLNGRAEAQVALIAAGEGITLSETSVLYSVAAEPFIQHRLRVPIRVVNAPEGERYEINPREVDVLVSVPQSQFGRITPDDFRVEANIANLRDGNFSPSVALQLIATPKQVVSAFLQEKVATYYAIR